MQGALVLILQVMASLTIVMFLHHSSHMWKLSGCITYGGKPISDSRRQAIVIMAVIGLFYALYSVWM